MESPEDKELKEKQERENVVQFFLRLHRHHFRASKNTPSKVRNVASDGSVYTYELEVEREGLPEIRRMAIALIGDGGGSKSRCYKVSYDDLLVVKIPPTPITTFEAYIENINAERRIAAKLAPDREFVVPGVSVIIKRLQNISDSEGLSPIEVERKYIKWLKTHPKNQRFLKIKNTFVFVMDLSKHAFLSEVLDRLHLKGELQAEMRSEIMQCHDLVWDIIAFEEKYGHDVASISFEMPKVFSEYETSIRSFLEMKQKSTLFTTYEKHQWLIDHLAEGYVELNRSEHSMELEKALNEVIHQVMVKNQDVIDSYRATIRDYIRTVKFSQNKAKMAGIVTNITELIACLHQKGLSIRDLKPDNLFVVGSPELNPFLFNSADSYSLGLIDFETAVLIKPKNYKQIEQPLRAGTPSYATPSHMFKNDILIEIFGDLPRILHLQDWYAAVGIIFNIVTGETLFEQTRKWLSKIKEITKNAIEAKKPPAFIVETSSKHFWGAAQNEFNKKTEANKNSLRSVEVALSDTFSGLVSKELEQVNVKLMRTLQKRIISQVIFNGDKNRQNLIKSSYNDIYRYRIKWEQGNNIPKTPPKTQEEIVRLLKDLEHLKALQRENELFIDIFTKIPVKIKVLDLMQTMFHVVLRSMYNEEWGKLAEDESLLYPEELPDVTDETTILYEATIMYD